MTQDLLGYESIGSGPTRVLVLNDWLCDTSTWDGARPYLDAQQFSWVFADLRGYGRSRGRAGEFTLREAADDVLALIEHLRWERLSLVGHSMSTLIAMHLAQRCTRLERIVLLTPPPPQGFRADEITVRELQAITCADGTRAEMVRQRFSTGRLSAGWARFKSERFVATSDAAAAAAYIPMYAREGLPEPERAIALPVLAITGEQDMEVMRRAAVSQNLAPLCTQLQVASLSESGHYPMQEMPPLTVALIERFLGT
jgi:pimeloyl-ACP methyl ester carboxylesterase